MDRPAAERRLGLGVAGLAISAAENCMGCSCFRPVGGSDRTVGDRAGVGFRKPGVVVRFSAELRRAR